MISLEDPDGKMLTDPFLTEMVKKEDERALSLLIERHSGIYVDMVKRYGSSGLNSTDLDDVLNEKNYIIYQAALNYDEEKAKFSTYVGNRAKYLCLSKKTSLKKNSKFVPFESIDFSEESNSLQPSENCETKDSFIKIMAMINEHPDKRVKVIFKERYFGGEKGKLSPWKNVAGMLGLSMQRCIDIHNKTIKEFQTLAQKNA